MSLHSVNATCLSQGQPVDPGTSREIWWVGSGGPGYVSLTDRDLFVFRRLCNAIYFDGPS